MNLDLHHLPKNIAFGQSPTKPWNAIFSINSISVCSPVCQFVYLRYAICKKTLFRSRQGLQREWEDEGEYIHSEKLCIGSMFDIDLGELFLTLILSNSSQLYFLRIKVIIFGSFERNYTGNKAFKNSILKVTNQFTNMDATVSE